MLRRAMMAGGGGGGGGTDPHWANVVSLLHFDGDFSDESGKAWTVRGAPGFDTDSAFGPYAMRINPSTLEGLFHPRSSDFSINQGVTAEVRVKPHPTDNAERLIFEFNDTLVNNQHRLAVVKTADYKIRVISMGAFGASNVRDHTTVDQIPADTYSHIALCMDESRNLRLFVSGVQRLSFSVADASPNAASLYMALGTLASGAHTTNFRGLIDEFRVTKGVVRYTDNFTPPSAPFPSG